MQADTPNNLLGHIRNVAIRYDAAGLTDGQLLGQFVGRRDGTAFAALVRRHGPMVLGVCRRIVGNHHDAEDAFQATFLVLALKAKSVVPREAVGNWLHGVACRTALKARTVAARRLARERLVAELPPVPEVPRGETDLRRLLDLELSRLPEIYRLPIVLCDLEGRTRREVARQLEIPDGTLSNRLATGRRMLARRLARLGLSVVAVSITSVLSASMAPACVPAELRCLTVRSAAKLAAGSATASVVAAPVITLMQGELGMMVLTRIKFAAVLLLAVTLAGTVRPVDPPEPTPVKQPVFDARPRPAGRPGDVAEVKPFPPASYAKAYVKRRGNGELELRPEFTARRLLMLKDADGKTVQIPQSTTWEAPPFRVELDDVRVHDVRGNPRKLQDWLKGLKEETLVFLVFYNGEVPCELLAETYQIYRADMTVLVLPTASIEGLDSSKAFPPVKSLGQDLRAVPPPAKKDD